MTNLMKGKKILITGSTDGIGKQTALELAQMGAHIIIHGRNVETSQRALKEIQEKSGNKNIEAIFWDLSSIKEVWEMAAEIRRKYKQLDVLINNAGVFKNHRELSKDGFELTFAINHLSYFLLGNLLLDLLDNSPQGRMINVASMAHATELDFLNLQGEKYFDGYDAYSRSKLCNIMFTYALANRIQGSNTTVNCLHPGVISTKLLHEGFGSGGARLSEGSKTSVYLASSPDVKNTTGKYFANQQKAKSAPISHNKIVQDKLWEVSKGMVGL
jgi:NAD(P)-dependent dehydrogenase (short-subunit alcohol dehydrogenase family)